MRVNVCALGAAPRQAARGTPWPAPAAEWRRCRSLSSVFSLQARHPKISQKLDFSFVCEGWYRITPPLHPIMQVIFSFVSAGKLALLMCSGQWTAIVSLYPQGKPFRMSAKHHLTISIANRLDRSRAVCGPIMHIAPLIWHRAHLKSACLARKYVVLALGPCRSTITYLRKAHLSKFGRAEYLDYL